MSSPTIDLSEIAPEKVIKTRELSRYESWRDSVHREMVALGTCIHICDRILRDEFVWLLNPPSENNFWLTARVAIFEKAIMELNVLWFDQKNDGAEASLSQFKNAVANTMVKQQYQAAVKQALKEKKPKGLTKNILDNVKHIRDKWVAHSTDKALPAGAPSVKETLAHFENAAVSLRECFDIVCFGHEFSWQPIDYVGSKADQSDIDKIVLQKAAGHWLVSLPERDPIHWESVKHRLGEPDLELMRLWRDKLALPAVV